MRINQYNICDKTLQNGIREPKGLITSPNYPTYTPVVEGCTQAIIAPENKIIKIWMALDTRST